MRRSGFGLWLRLPEIAIRWKRVLLMRVIAATSIAVPPYLLTREDVKTYMRRVFDVGERRLDAMMTVIDNAQVHQRHSIFPVDYIITPRTLEQLSLE